MVRGRGGRGRGNGSYKGRIHSGNYTPKDWAALSQEQFKKVLDLRKKERKRNTSEVTTETEEEEPVDNNIGSQFGRNGSSKKDKKGKKVTFKEEGE